MAGALPMREISTVYPLEEREPERPTRDLPPGTVLTRARAAGREHLLETEGLALVRALGIGAPLHRCVSGAPAAEHLDLSAFPGDRVVVKVLAERSVDRCDVGGVAIVPRERAAVAAAVRGMERRFAAEPVCGFAVFELVPHDDGPAGELLLGLRWTDELGPVVAFGPVSCTVVLPTALTCPERIAAALAGLRHPPPRVTATDLAALLRRCLDFAAATLPHEIREIAIEPLVFTARGPIALTARVRLRCAGARPLSRLRRLTAQ